MKKCVFLTVFVLISGAALVWWKVPGAGEKVRALAERFTRASRVEETVETEEEVAQEAVAQEPEDLWIFKSAYPDIVFESEYVEEKADWKVSVTVGKRSADFYWCEGRMLPESELENRDRYWTLLYHYDREIKNPLDFTEEEIQQIRNFSSPENRSDGPGTPPFFYDLVYQCRTRALVEEHIVKSRFLGKKTNCHERLVEPLGRVEKRILEASESDEAVRAFLKNLLSTDSYSWRKIRDSRSRSFHSVGIAIDVLPNKWWMKKIYWAWQRDFDPDNWMLLPLEKRWIPPQAVIDIFEEEGFIWGGKWAIWDNMHFEYHPEIILKNYGTEPTAGAGEKSWTGGASGTDGVTGTGGAAVAETGGAAAAPRAGEKK